MKEAATAGAQSVRRAVAILRIVAAAQERGARLADVVAQAALSRPTAHRLLQALAEEGAIERDAGTRRYRIGEEVSLLGLARTARFPVRAVADPYLRQLADGIGDTVFLTIASGTDTICIDRKTGDYPVKVLALEVGARRPFGVGVAGVALLARWPADEAAAVVRANEARLAAHGLTASRVLEQVRAARARGFAYTDTGIVKGTRAVALALAGPDGRPAAAISVAALSGRLAARRLAAVVHAMREQAGRIEGRLAAVARTSR